MGKRQISQLTFFDYINGISIGSMASTLAVDVSRESIPTLVGILTWSLWVMVLALLAVKSRTLRSLIDGKPTIAIQNGKILGNNIHTYGYSIDDLRMLLREKDVFRLSEVEFALIEADGSLSVLKKSQNSPVTPEDLNIPTAYKGLSVDIISQGKMIRENLKLLRLSENWLAQKLAARKLTLRQIYYAELDSSGTLFIDLYQDQDINKGENNG